MAVAAKNHCKLFMFFAKMMLLYNCTDIADIKVCCPYKHFHNSTNFSDACRLEWRSMLYLEDFSLPLMLLLTDT